MQHQALWRRAFVTVGGRVEHNDSFGTRGRAARIDRASSLASRDRDLGETTLHGQRGTRHQGADAAAVVQPVAVTSTATPISQPERSRTVEAGIEQRLAGDRAKIGVTWFDNRYRESHRDSHDEPGDVRGRVLQHRADPRARRRARDSKSPRRRRCAARAGYTFLDSEIVDSTSPFDPVFSRASRCSAGRATPDSSGVDMDTRIG